MAPLRFPFGRPVIACPPSAGGPRRLFVLGAYPSALHIRWAPPAPFKPIRALAVENEPTPFWTGGDDAERVEAWKEAVGWKSAFGSAGPAGKLNGSSGGWVDANVLDPLGALRDEAWITDCLDTYRVSEDAAARLLDTYRPFAGTVGLPLDELPRHPAEGEIVAEAVRDHRDRLTRELEAARADLVVTLGNAALRVLACLVEVEGHAPRALSIDGYGLARRIQLGGRPVEWLPLAHPASPPAYQEAHARWRAARKQERPGPS